MKKVTGIKKHINDTVIEILEELLEKAKDGDIDAVVIGFVKTNREVDCKWSGGSDCLRSWSAVVHAERAFYERVVKNDNEDEY